LGMMSLGCVLQNIWLAAAELGIGAQILSATAGNGPECVLRELLGIPAHMNVAFAIRLGYPLARVDYLRVRRSISTFVHHNRYGRQESRERPPSVRVDSCGGEEMLANMEGRT